MIDRRLVRAAIGVSFLACWMLFSFAEEPEKSAESDLRELLLEHHAVLEQRAETIRAANQQGNLGMDQVLEAANDALGAELELAETPEDRIAIRRKMLDNASKIEQIFQLQSNNGMKPIQDFLQAKADRIEFQIALVREQNGTQ
ncbi:MAG: hypothetical protein ACR2NZ_25325 [Rubripirellula sp.]